jgi:hypothetical protein
MENLLLWGARIGRRDQGLVPEGGESSTAEDTMPRGVLGMNASMFKGCPVTSPTDAPQIGLSPYPRTKKPVDEQMTIFKKGTYFETRVIEYSHRRRPV